MKLLKMQSMISAKRHSLLLLSKNKYLAFIFLFVLVVNFFFFFTYPINVAAYDYPNYLAMMHDQVSNLVHASGYPAFFMVLLSIFDVPQGSTIYDIAWLNEIQRLQFLLHTGLLLCCLIICTNVFNQLSAIIMCLVWGLSTLFMAGVDSAAPEWLLGELMALSFLLSAQAFICKSNKKKIIGYAFSGVIFSYAYLVKYNALLVFPILALILIFDRKSVCWKFFVISMSIVSCLALILAFVEFFHYPTTKSKQLNYDHAWVLLNDLPSQYLSLPSEQLEINSLRWKALSSVVPVDYSTARAYCCIETGAPADVRDAYYIKYRQIMRLSKNELIVFLKSNPLPNGFITELSAIPLYWYIGFPEIDALGIATFKEALLSNPMIYINKIFTGIKSWSTYDKQMIMVPFYSNKLALIFGENINHKNGFIKIIPTVHVHNPPISQLYWNPQEVVWRPGILGFESFTSIIMPRWMELLIFVGAMLGVLFSTNASVRFLGFVLLCAIATFSAASYVLLGMRFKEYISIIPLVAIFYGVGLSASHNIFRDVFVLKIGRHPIK
ncbi:MAG: hypothetical protein HOP02_13090 [Methylococcaceae bacterium]|nr:hypothetical protein [Methylococcaceae bacterium]